MVNECQRDNRDIKVESFTELLKQVDRVTYHSELVNDMLVSIFQLRVPVINNEPRLIKKERQAAAPPGQHVENEKVAAVEVFAREMKYMLEHSTSVEEPVFAEDEDGSIRIIGQQVTQINRNKLALPTIKEDSIEGFYLDCVRE